MTLQETYKKLVQEAETLGLEVDKNTILETRTDRLRACAKLQCDIKVFKDQNKSSKPRFNRKQQLLDFLKQDTRSCTECGKELNITNKNVASIKKYLLDDGYNIESTKVCGQTYYTLIQE